ncbi:MAG: ROK family protein, partial [Bacteroidales bacterium]|nr:ROK family protein [Bacteroidales bacterium]
MDKPYVAGVDIGGQTTKIGIVDLRGIVLAQGTIRSDRHTDPLLYIDELSDTIISLATRAGAWPGKLRGIGVGSPNGNYYTGCIENAVNIIWAGPNAIPFTKLLTERSGLPSALTNDAN